MIDFRQYYKTGELEYETIFNEDSTDVFRNFYKNGQLSYFATYYDSLAHGPCKSFYENGKIEYELFYLNDSLISESCWDKNGSEIECIY